MTKAFTCDQCGSEIDHVILICNASAEYTYTPSKRGPEAFGPTTVSATGDPFDTICPVCGDTVSPDAFYSLEQDEISA